VALPGVNLEEGSKLVQMAEAWSFPLEATQIETGIWRTPERLWRQANGFPSDELPSPRSGNGENRMRPTG